MRARWLAVLSVVCACACASAPAPLPEKPARVDPPPPCAAEPAVWIRADGAWIGARAGAARFAPSCGGKLDRAAVGDELCRLGREADVSCATAITFAADAAVVYDEVIAGMVAARGAGFPDATFVDPGALPFKFPAQVGERLPARCGQEAPACAPRPPHERPRVDRAPVVAVSPDEIFVNGRDVAHTADALRQAGPVIPELLDALTAPKPTGTLILQADKRVPALVITRVVNTALAAGYPNILFAVENLR